METNKNNVWDILGIETTKDEKKIRDAYREKLSVTNPEDKPEEFKQLRSAYEQALDYARRPEETEDEDRQIDAWLRQLNDIYNDFAKRKNVGKDLFEYSLDTVRGFNKDAQALGFHILP